MKNILSISLGIILATLTCCQKKDQAQSSEAVSVAYQKRQDDTVILKGYSVHFVRLPFTHKMKDENGREKQYDKAWLVRFDLDKFPKLVSLKMDFAIGDYLIPEYGSTKNGIYFKIYESSLLETLNDQEIFYQPPGKPKMITTTQTFKTSNYKDLKLEEERKVITGN